MTKECGTCSLCCKLPKISELDKPLNKWCTHCNPGHGCKIWESRPQVCRDFSCLWLMSPKMPERMKPNKCKLFVSPTLQSEVMQVFVDPGFPNAWRVGSGKEVVDTLKAAGHHMFIVCGDTRFFVQGDGKPIPKQVMDALKKSNLFDVEKIA